MYVHRMSQLEKQMDGHDVTHLHQSQQDLEVHFDHVHQRNTYRGSCISTKEGTEQCQNEATYAEVCQTELHNFGHGTAIPQ